MVLDEVSNILYILLRFIFYFINVSYSFKNVYCGERIS